MRPVQPVFTVALLSRSGRYSHPLAQLVLGRKARQNRDCDSATVFLKLAAESGPPGSRRPVCNNAWTVL